MGLLVLNHRFCDPYMKDMIDTTKPCSCVLYFNIRVLFCRNQWFSLTYVYVSYQSREALSHQINGDAFMIFIIAELLQNVYLFSSNLEFTQYSECGSWKRLHLFGGIKLLYSNCSTDSLNHWFPKKVCQNEGSLTSQ